MAKVTGWESHGGYYRSGYRFPGWGRVHLDNGGSMYIGEADSYIGRMMDCADEAGHDTREARQKIKHWIKTGEGVNFRVA